MSMSVTNLDSGFHQLHADVLANLVDAEAELRQQLPVVERYYWVQLRC